MPPQTATLSPRWALNGSPGGRLADFPKEWLASGSQFARGVVTTGLRLNLLRRIKPNNPPPVRMDPALLPAADKAVQELLDKQAIEPLNSSRPIFSPFFVVAQGEKIRPILDCRRVNRALAPPHFHMEDMRTIRPLIRQGDWLTKIDLKDAYLHVPIHPADRRFLAFHWNGKDYQFKVLPFGLATAPWIFTRLMKLVTRKLRALGLRLASYLDDVCLISSSREMALREGELVARTLQEFGFLVNWKKSTVMFPSQVQEFLGTIVDTKEMTLSLSKKKLSKLSYEARALLKRSDPIPSKKLASFIGLVQSSRLAIHPTMIFTRFLLRDLQKATFRRNWDSSSVQSLSPEAMEELHWWVEEAWKWNGSPILEPTPSETLTTDASETGWGATWRDKTLQGWWSPEEMGNSSNWRELKAIELALRTIAPQIKGKPLLIQTDNTTAMSNVRRQGGSSTLSLLQIAKSIWNTALEQKVRITANHLPGILNVAADRASRRRHHRDDYRISRKWFNHLEQALGKREIDLFSTRFSALLPKYVTWAPDPQAEYLDAFSRPLPKEGGYAHPPPMLIGKLLAKALQEKPKDLIIVTPDWRTASFRPLLELIAERRWHIPKEAIIGPPNHRLSAMNCGVIAWRLSESSIARKAYLIP
jgi:hypothetical protein